MAARSSPAWDWVMKLRAASLAVSADAVLESARSNVKARVTQKGFVIVWLLKGVRISASSFGRSLQPSHHTSMPRAGPPSVLAETVSVVATLGRGTLGSPIGLGMGRTVYCVPVFVRIRAVLDQLRLIGGDGLAIRIGSGKSRLENQTGG